MAPFLLWPNPQSFSPGLNNFDLGMRFMKEGVYRPFLLYVDLNVL